MRFSIFSFFDNRKITLAAFRAFIADTVVFNDFQLCRDKDQFTAHKFLTDLFQWGIADRTEPFLFRDIQIFFFYGQTFKTLCICCAGLPLFSFFFRKQCCQLFGFSSCRILFHFSFVEKVQLSWEISGTFFAGSAKKFFTEKFHFLFQVITLLCKGFFPFISGIDSCLKGFY